MKMKKKVVCAMSGGIDSSVAAALLKEKGFDVVGIFCYFWSDPALGIPNPNKCCSSEALKAARAVASTLGIPLHTLDLKEQFKRDIVDYFISEYKSCRTPNPCVVCNKKIKFGKLLEEVKKLGADLLATGHYTRVSRKILNSKYQITNKFQISNNKFQNNHLFKGIDERKDQSYFLWQLDQKQLKHLIFPIGNYKKEQVKKLSQKFKLPVTSRPESQEICFVPDDNYRKFLEKYAKNFIKPGKVVDLKGNVLGEHRGLPFYTIGQRKGLGIGGPVYNPWYVLKLDCKNNTLIVGKDEDLYKKEVNLKSVNWISGKIPQKPMKAKVKIRYGMKEQNASISQISNFSSKMSKLSKSQILFNKPQRASTPGQSAVFYQGEELLGGGIIKS